MRETGPINFIPLKFAVKNDFNGLTTGPCLLMNDLLTFQFTAETLGF